MGMRNIAIALVVFLVLVGGFFVFLIASDSSGAAANQAAAGIDPGTNKALEAKVLAGYEVKFWGDGRPFVKYYDPGAGEYATQDIRQALFWQAQYAAGDESAMTGSVPGGHFDGAEAAYRLGLIYEYGLFGYGIDFSEAMRNYRIAKVGGHADAPQAEQRLIAAGVR